LVIIFLLEISFVLGTLARGSPLQLKEEETLNTGLAGELTSYYLKRKTQRNWLIEQKTPFFVGGKGGLRRSSQRLVVAQFDFHRC